MRCAEPSRLGLSVFVLRIPFVIRTFLFLCSCNGRLCFLYRHGSHVPLPWFLSATLWMNFSLCDGAWVAPSGEARCDVVAGQNGLDRVSVWYLSAWVFLFFFFFAKKSRFSTFVSCRVSGFCDSLRRATALNLPVLFFSLILVFRSRLSAGVGRRRRIGGEHLAEGKKTKGMKEGKGKARRHDGWMALACLLACQWEMGMGMK